MWHSRYVATWGVIAATMMMATSGWVGRSGQLWRDPVVDGGGSGRFDGEEDRGSSAAVDPVVGREAMVDSASVGTAALAMGSEAARRTLAIARMNPRLGSRGGGDGRLAQ